MAASVTSVAEVLAAVIAELPGGGEARPGQADMAEAVSRAIASGQHLVAQAGTGTGKSLAYLVPLVLSGRRCVIVTATKALQDQLADKDLPFLTARLSDPPSFSILKGRSNYLCLQKAAEIGQESQGRLELDGPGDADVGREVVSILEWAKRSPTGDRAELAFEPSFQAWSRLSVTAEECPGAYRCPMGESCFAEAAKRRADEADLVVVNAHLYGSDLAGGGQLLGNHDIVVVDEAHELEDVAATTLGLELGAARFRALGRAVRGVMAEPAEATAVEEAAVTLERALEPYRDRRLDPSALVELRRALAVAAHRLERTTSALRDLPLPSKGTSAALVSARRERAMKVVTSLADDVGRAAESDDKDVAWVEGPPHAPVLRVAPIDVGPALASRLWSKRTAVLTSATIPPGFASRLGMQGGTFAELDVSSPFSYRTQALLYVAKHLPDPRSPRWEAGALAELEALIRAAGGRTLALFTSWRMMTTAAEALRPRLPWRLLTQSDLPKPALLRSFADEETCCLFATLGFWQGVDIPGPSLSLVALDRIPFPRPDDPLTQARRERAGPAAFANVDLPRAATLLAQGAGRLIRSATDRGVVAVLDPRLATMPYRVHLLAKVPPMKRTISRAEVIAFLAPPK